VTLTCRLTKSLAPLYAGRELEGGLLGRLDAHVAGCADCAALVERYQRDRARLMVVRGAREEQALGPEMGERFWHGVRRELRTEGLVGPGAAKRRRRAAEPLVMSLFSRGLMTRGLAAAAVVAVAVWVGPFWERGGDAGPGAGGTAGVTAGSRARASGGAVRVQPVAAGLGAAGAVFEALPGPGGLERVRLEAGAATPWIEPIEPYGPPAIRYQLEGWQAPSGERAVEEF
jgi:hypothetical protein